MRNFFFNFFGCGCDSEHVSGTLCHHFYMHKWGSGNCASDLLFEVGDGCCPLCSLLPIPWFVFVLFFGLRKKHWVDGKKIALVRKS